ncbi:MAG: type II secretion system protein GspC [Pseudomonadota bacterium]
MLSSANESPAASNALNRAAAVTVMVLGGALALWTLARLFWAVMDLTAPPPSAGTTVAAPTAGTPAAAGVDLASLHLFGQAGLAPEPIVIEAPETQLNLTLLGTFAAEDPEAGFAIVADDRDEQGRYRAGDDLPGNATLREIFADRIVLERQGRRETLRLEREATVGGPGGTTATSAPSRPAVAAAPAARSAPTAADWESFRNNSRLDTDKLLRLGQQIRAMPVMENGRPVGVRLIAARDAQLLNRLGLRSSDVILAVNGIPLSDPTRQLELMRLLNTQSRFEVKMRRNGQDVNLSVDASALQR